MATTLYRVEAAARTADSESAQWSLESNGVLCPRSRRSRGRRHIVCRAGRVPPEVFSVAPMMGHTHRHYRFFFRLLSKHAWLYTEMLPAAQCQGPENDNLLFNACEHPLALQLGGHDVQQLATATKVATHLGYDAVNLNCGCPSPNVTNGARRGGAAMMRSPEHVAICLSAMIEAASDATRTGTRASVPLITVKHRLNVVNDTLSEPYDAIADHEMGYEADLNYARRFIGKVASVGVTRFQVHARKALLSDESFYPASHQLWAPDADIDNTGKDGDLSSKKIDHKRRVKLAQKYGRWRTLFNRSVPPLRPEIVQQLSREFPNLELVSNGGIDSISGVKDRLNQGLHGVMVGRAVINHPVLFAGLDETLFGRKSDGIGKKRLTCETRGEVLDRYIEYVEEEEERLNLNALLPEAREAELRKLTSPPYSLFVGEAGCDKYQRRIRNMSRRFMTRPYTASGVLRAARTEIQLSGSYQKKLLSAVPLDKINRYEDAFQRAGPMQKMIA